MSSRPSSSDPEWKKLKLSFERPYKDDAGNRIPVLEDITPEGQFIYEPVLSQAEKRDANLRRIFQEKGHNFFEINDPTTISSKTQPTVDEDSSNLKDNDPQITEESDVKKTMSIEELFAMRSDIMPQLHVALGEMFHAKELLMALLSNPVIESSQPSSSFSATLVTKPAPIPSVQAFNAQLITGSKDEALRKAAGLFKNAAYRMEKGRARGEKYWVNALKIRRANWGLSPAPLPPGSATGKGADKTSKDFLVSYGLEGSSPSFRRQAIAHLQRLADSSGDLVFPHHQTPRLRISVAWKNQSKGQKSTYFPPKNTSQDLDDILRAAQREIVDQEIFSLLVKAAGRLPTASARVSERLIVIDTPSDVELTFELTSDEFHATSDSKQPGDISELIYYMLRVLMLQNRHPEHSKSFTDGVGDTPSILQPIFELVQYQMLLQFVHEIMGHANNGLRAAGIPCKLSFNPVGENGQEILSVLSDKGYAHMGGEAVLHIDKGHVLRLTFAAPSSLTVHLPQATILILSLPQLSQLLMDEIERSILNRICALGRSISSSVGSTWFIDLNRCVARWEGCVLNFQVSFTEEFAISCSAFCLKGSVKSPAITKIYRPGQETLFAWIEYFIRHVM